MATHTIRSQSPLTLDQIRKVAPSVFATEPFEGMSAKYAFIPTSQALKGLMDAGFEVYEAGQTVVRNADKRAYAKHMLRMRKAGSKALRKVGDEFPEVVLFNSHDGTSAYSMVGGIYRLVCSNGMVVGRDFDSVKVRHSGNIVDDVIEGSFRVVDEIGTLGDRIEQYSSITLEPQEQLLLASSAITARWGDNKIVTPEAVNASRRPEDSKPDLWTTFNRIQENVTKGEVRGRSASGRRLKTRPVGSINEDAKLNRALFELCDGFAKLKGGA